jgi:hypothetical protein
LRLSRASDAPPIEGFEGVGGGRWHDGAGRRRWHLLDHGRHMGSGRGCRGETSKDGEEPTARGRAVEEAGRGEDGDEEEEGWSCRARGERRVTGHALGWPAVKEVFFCNRI